MRRTFPLDHRIPALHLSFFVQTFGPLVLSLACLPLAGQAHAQAPITQSGLNTQVSPPIAVGTQTQYNITGGTRPGGTSGTNLFHSFGNFNVPTNNIANFLNESALPTNNILGRVTGGNLSSIYGTIQTTGFGNANLFLMNPAGFLFGPNATVNVGGMVAFTSADYLRLIDGVRFNATPNATADALLTPSPVAAFGFLGSNPGAITVQGSQFSVTDGQSISLVGGDITIQSGTLDDGTVQSAKLSAPGGQINLASVASPGEVSAVDFMPTSGMTMGNISLSQDTLLDVSADAAGTVRIRGGQLVMDHATISADTVNSNGAPLAIDINLASDLSISSAAVPALTARTTGTGDAGEIRISAQNIEMTATGYGDFTPFAVIDTHTSGSGKAGDVNITASNNIAFNGDPFDFVFAIDSGTIGLDGGHGGNVALNAKNVDFQYAQIGTGDFVAVYSFADAVGSGGNLTINADSLNLTNSFLVTDGFFGGRGGDLTISARDVQMNQFSALSASGFLKGGTLRINADHFFVDSSQMEAFAGPEGGGAIIFNGKVGQFTNGTTIQSGTGSPGNAGNITFTATERLTFADSTDLDLAPIRPSGLFTTSIFSTGNAGEITVNTPVLELTGGARFDATTRTLGDGGRITVNADTISISGERPLPIFEGPLFGLATSMASGIYSRTAQSRFCGGGCGKAGSISITTDSLSLTQGARIDTNTTSAGLGGDITITANQISIAGTTIDGTSGGIFTAASAAGAGGNISINANSVTLQNGGTLSAATSGTEATATGGTITVKADQVQLNSGTTVSAETTGAGKAGSIDIAAQRISLTGGSQITASTGTPTSGSGDAGAIRITATESLSLTDASLIASNSNSTSADAGHAGLIELTAPSIDLQGSSLLTSSTRGPGNAGSIILNLAQLSLSDFSNIATSTTGPGRGGDITVQGLAGPGSHAETVTLSGASRLGAESMDCCGTGSVGDAGSISVATGKLLLTGNSQIVTSTQVGSGNAGDIIINATDEVRLSESRLASESIAFASGNAGSVTVTAPNVVLENQGLISTSTEFAGTAGDITVNANSLQLTSGAQITSNSRNAVMELITEFPEFADFFLVTGPAGAAGTVTVHGSAGPANTVFIDGAGSGIFTETRAEGAGGNITLSANSVTLQNGGTLSAATSGTGNAGNISVIADQVTLTNFAQMTTSTTGPGSGGTIHLSAEDTISLTDSFISASSNSTGSDAGSGGQITLRAPTLSVVGGVVSTITLGSGNAGNIHIQAGTFGLGTSEGAPGLVEATTSGAGHGGNISIVGLTGPGSPANDVTLSGFSSIRSETLNNQGGTAGDITIETMRLALTEGSAITTASRLNSPGNAGNVTLNATESILVSGSYVTSDVLEGSTGNGGQVTIKTPDLTVNQSSEGFGGLISTSTGSSGSAGTVTINTNSLTLTEGGRLASRSFLDDPIYPTATGAAGAVVVQGMSGDSSRANSIVINGQDGFGNVSGIFTNTEGSGHGGNMALFANTVSLQSGATLSAATSGTAPSAIGGTIAVDASNTVTMTGGATMTANSSGAADAGSINITALNGFSMQNSAITTQVTPSPGSSAGGGNIKITTSPEATVLLQNSTISASVADGPGGGGNISIDPQFVILQNSQILAQAAQGQGGAITIVAGLFLPDATSVVNADSGSGLNGNITIQSPNSPASGKIIPLSDRPLIAAALLSQRCAALAGGNFSSFTVAGRESLPAEPGGWLSSPLALALSNSGSAPLTEAGLSISSSEPSGERPLLSLRQIAPMGFLSQTFAVDSAGCGS